MRRSPASRKMQRSSLASYSRLEGAVRIAIRTHTVRLGTVLLWQSAIPALALPRSVSSRSVVFELCAPG
jgi:hypothetical protein